MAIPSTTMPLIVQFMENNCLLEELDLSWNNFKPQDFLDLMNCLQQNVILKVLNLSWNLLIPSSQQRLKSDFNYPVRNDKFFDREDYEMSHAEIMANRFSKLIRYNQTMQHIDLTNTGLSEVFLFQMLPALRRAKGLLSFHVGANPGVNKKISQYWMEKLRCLERPPPISIMIQKEKNNYKRILEDKRAMKKLSKQKMSQLQFKSKQMDQMFAKEIFSQNSVIHSSNYHSLTEVTVKTSAADMSIQRVLGCKEDIPGSGQWRMQKNQDENGCWCCNNSIYTLIFWNKEIGQAMEEYGMQIDDGEKERVIKLINGY